MSEHSPLIDKSPKFSPRLAGSAGAKGEDEQWTQLLKEEEAHISDKIVALRKDVRTQKDLAKRVETLHASSDVNECTHTLSLSPAPVDRRSCSL